ncbi:STAS domain-containing protein [Streptomyces sp. NPDC091272]|uniref:STAS domain-containing protein n=1 Tax=Streptomyces sp. NPDC091272 TaxID=3365981 RepID=UPI0037FFBCA5
MSFEAYYGFSGATATIHLSGQLTDRQVPALHTLVEQVLSRPVRRLVLRVHELDSLTAGGVRCLAFAQQRLPPDAEIVMDGAGPQLRSVLAASGFEGSVTVIGRALALPDESAA